MVIEDIYTYLWYNWHFRVNLEDETDDSVRQGRLHRRTACWLSPVGSPDLKNIAEAVKPGMAYLLRKRGS
jgi:hypothetical protein